MADALQAVQKKFGTIGLELNMPKTKIWMPNEDVSGLDVNLFVDVVRGMPVLGTMIPICATAG